MPATTPSDAYRRIATLLKDRNEMPTGADLYALRITDPIMAWLWARIEDWMLYQIALGYPVQRHADNDCISQEYEATRNGALERLRALPGFSDVQATDHDFDSLVSAMGVLNEGAPRPTDRDAYTLGLIIAAFEADKG
jgi:hypothetical protein